MITKISHLSVVQKVYDFELYIYDILEKFPRSERYAMITRLKNTLRELIRRLIKAGESDKKKGHLYDADCELKFLKYEFRLAKDLRYISLNRYKIISEKLNEVGSMLGGWIKNLA